MSARVQFNVYAMYFTTACWLIAAATATEILVHIHIESLENL